MPNIASPRFYVYVLSRPDGSPFYVGKGRGRRVYWHDSEARRGCRCHKCNVIRKIWLAGGEVQRSIVFTTDDELTALTHERTLVAFYGRAHLTNQTDGGEGTPDFVVSDETRAKMRAAKRGRRLPASHKAAIAKAGVGRRPSETTREKLRAIARNRTYSAETRAKWSEQRRGRRPSDETRAKLSQAKRGALFTDQRRANISAALRATPLNKVPRGPMSDATKAKISAKKRERDVARREQQDAS